MLYLAMILGAASLAFAQKDPQLPRDMQADPSFPRFTAASKTGILPDGFFGGVPIGGAPSLSTRAFSTGMTYPAAPLSSIEAIPNAKLLGGEPIILVPMVPKGHDTTHLDNVIPGNQHTLHYAENDTTGT